MKIPECDRCLLYSHNPHIICAVHPDGVTYYNGELILQPRQRWTLEEQLELLDWHPLFTGKCPQCGAEYERDYISRVHWDCPNSECGWMDDSV